MLIVVDHVLELMDEHPGNEIHCVGRRNVAAWIRRQAIENLGAIRANKAGSEVSSEEVPHHYRAAATGELGHPVSEEHEHHLVAVDVRLAAERRDVYGVEKCIEGGSDLVDVGLGIAWGRRRIV